MKNKIEDLRNHLFAALEELGDPDKKPDLERMRTICHVAAKIIDTAKVEVDFVAATGALKGTGFIETEKSATPPLKMLTQNKP